MVVHHVEDDGKPWACAASTKHFQAVGTAVKSGTQARTNAVVANCGFRKGSDRQQLNAVTQSRKYGNLGINVSQTYREALP